MVAASASPTDWKQLPAIGPNPSGMTVEVDLASRRPSKTLWIRIAYAQPDRDGVLYALIQHEVDCSQDQIRALNALMYDKDHRVIKGMGRTKPDAWRIVPPEPGLDQSILSIGCRRVRFSTEQQPLDEFLGGERKVPVLP